MSESFERRRKERELRRAERRAKLTEMRNNTQSMQDFAGLMATTPAKEVYVKNMPIFKGCESAELIEAVCDRFERTVFHKGSIIAQDGTDADCIFYISSGEATLEVSGSVVGTLKPGSSFGDVPCLTGRKRLGTVRATYEVVAYALRREELLAVLATHPEENERIRKVVEEAQGGSEEYRNAERRMRSYFAALRAHGPQQGPVPEHVREDVVVTLAQEIKRSSLFAESKMEFVRDLAAQLQPRVVVEGDVVFQEGTLGDEMFLVSSGRVSIVKGGVQIIECQRGATFGEIALVDSAPRSASAVAVSPADLLVLNKKQLDALLKRHPEEEKLIKAVVLKRRGSLTSQSMRVRGRVSSMFGQLRRDSSRVLTDIDDEARQDLTYAVNEQLRQVHLFRDASQAFVTELGKRLTPVVFDQGEFLFEEGDVGDSMYFLMEGEASMQHRSGQEILRLNEGSWVGEAALVTSDEKHRSASAKAISDLNTMRLCRQDLDEVLDKFPEQRINIVSLAQARMAQQAIQNLIGTPIRSEKEFQERVGDLLSQAIHDKNVEIHRLEKHAKELDSELSGSKERTATLTMTLMHQKRIAREALIQLHRQKEAEKLLPGQVEADGTKKHRAERHDHSQLHLESKSAWRRPEIRKALQDVGRKRRFELGRATDAVDYSKTSDVTAMLAFPRLADLLSFKSYVRKCIDQKWAHSFLESYGLASLIDCFVRHGDMLYENYFVIGGIQVVLFQTIELIFLALRDSLYHEENAFFIEAYVLRALDSFSSRLKNHSLQLLLELLQEVPARGAIMLDSLLQRYRQSPLRKVLNAPRWTPLLDLLELEAGSPLAITVLQTINAYIAAQSTSEARHVIRAELEGMGFGEILRTVKLDVERFKEEEPEEESRAERDTWLQDFEDEAETYRDAEESDNRDVEDIRNELDVDVTNLTEISSKIVSLVRGSDSAVQEMAQNVFQRMLLLVSDPALAASTWAFLEKVLLKAMHMTPESDVEGSVKMTTKEIATFLRQRRAHMETHQKEDKNVASEEEVVVMAEVPPSPPAAAAEGSSESAAPPPPPPPPEAVPPPPPPPGMGGPPPPPPPGIPGGPPPPPSAPGAPVAGAVYKGPKPKKKVKPLFWTKVAPFHAKGTVWEEPIRDDLQLKPNFDEIEDLFHVRNTHSMRDSSLAQATDEKTKKKDEVTTLLDVKRGNNVAIVLSQFRDLTFEQIRDAVASADSSVLSADRLSMLVHYLPTDEEMALINGYEGDPEKLGRAEKFYHTTMQLPRFGAKVEGFYLRSDFDTRIAELSGNITSLKNAAHEISTGHEFRIVLDAVLQIGNFLNAGTSRGNALGFKFDGLSKLKSVKSTDEQKVSLMQYLATFVEQHGEAYGRLHERYPSLSEALRLSVDQLNTDLEKLLGRLGAVEREVTLSRSEEASRAWCDQMSTFLGRARVEVEKNREHLNGAISQLTDVMQKYAVPTTSTSESGRSAQEEFLLAFNEFVEDWKKAREDNKRAQRMMEKIEARKEKKRREQMAKEEKRARLMAAGGPRSKMSVTQQVDNVIEELTRSGSVHLTSTSEN